MNRKQRQLGPGVGGIAKGRPPLAKKPQAALSSEKTRQLIRSHHQLNKQLASVENAGNREEADEIRKRIEQLGGLKSYQQASIQGQANDRGGDSSAVLMEWLKPLTSVVGKDKSKLRLLEVGALSTRNACSRSGCFDVERIDLNSQAEGIKQQDFMARSIPSPDGERFDVISLSLVLNYVPSPEGRGDMLKRTCEFLSIRNEHTYSMDQQSTLPALFLVLPAPCIVNSRYMSEERLASLMESLGYALLRSKQTSKLVFYLWQLKARPGSRRAKFSKKQVNPGINRNNFSIVLQH